MSKEILIGQVHVFNLLFLSIPIESWFNKIRNKQMNFRDEHGLMFGTRTWLNWEKFAQSMAGIFTERSRSVQRNELKGITGGLTIRQAQALLNDLWTNNQR
jgi:hypothetical protein